MKVLVTGAGGMLGTDLCAELSARGHEVIATDWGREGFVPLDVTDTKGAFARIREVRPDTILHCAAWTDVDGAERTPDPAYKVNALGAWNLAAAAAEVGALMVYLSTDFVFDGRKSTPYTEFDAVNPLGHYGASKEAGERLVRQATPRHIIVRTAYLFGVHGKNIAYAFMHLAKTQPRITAVADQVGCPTHTKDLSRKVCELIEDPLPGTYHICNAGHCSWLDFARAVVEGLGLQTPVVPIAAAEYAERFHIPTRRPDCSVMRRFALELRGMDDLPPWQEALKQFLALAPRDKK